MTGEALTAADFEISTKVERLDIDWLHHRMSTDTYWAKDRPRERVEQAVSHSKCYGVYHPAGHQVGFARLVTDYTVFAWLGDVYIDRSVRGIGLSKRLVEQIMSDVESLKLRRILLSTSDAHGLYRRFGFTEPESEGWMQKKWPDNL